MNGRLWSVNALVIALCATLLVTPATSGAERASDLQLSDPPEAGMDAGVLSRISDRMSESVRAKQISGAVTLVARKGRVVYLQPVGHADIEAERPMRAGSLFAIASMTKPITATAVMILQDEGRLSVDDVASKYLPQFAELKLDQGAPECPMTIRDLMTHTSGIGGSQRNQGSLKRTVELLAEQPLKFQPGSRWQYSPGLTVCGRIIEVVSGQPYDQFLEQRIFAPLRMVDTTFHPTADQQKRLVRLYKPGPEAPAIVPATHWLSDLSPTRTPNPSGGLFSTAIDMARFYQMILNGGELAGVRIVSEAAVREMTTIQTAELSTGFTPGNGWGLGWCVVRHPQGVTRMLSPGTFGHGGAFGTQGWVDPKREMIFVLMIQRNGFGNSDGSDIRGDFQELAVQAIRE